VPLLVNTLPLVPGATKVTAPVPLPTKMLFAVSDDCPVPPCAAVIGVETLLMVTLAIVMLFSVVTVLPS
jgi:hypothetical protein